MVLVSAVRPAALRDSRSIRGTGIDSAAARIARSVPKAYRRSLSDQNPAGESAVTDRTSFSRPSSRASRPPSELPATCGRSRPSASQKAPRTGTTVDRSYAQPAGSAGEVPKPGRSTATTSRSVARMSSTGSHACQWWPIPCSNRSGSPAPLRSYVTETVPGPAGVWTVNEICADIRLLLDLDTLSARITAQ